MLWRDICLRAGGLTVALSAFLGATLLAATPRADKLAVLFPPWWSPAEVLSAAAGAGRIVATGRLPASLIVAGDPRVLARDLRAAGALILLDATVRVGCSVLVPESAR